MIRTKINQTSVRFLTACLFVASIVFGLSACVRERLDEVIPAPPEHNYELIDDFNYPDTRSARRSWSAMLRTEPVSVLDINGTNVLRFPCEFKGRNVERATWEKSISMDLAACQGLQFYFFCKDPLPVSVFRFYLKSGSGWYAAKFQQANVDGWNRITIDKAEMGIEGEPAGWSKIDAVRISVWRGADADTVFYISHLGLLGADARVAVVRGDSAAKTRPDELRSITDYTEMIVQHLKNLGISYCVISDLDLTQKILSDKKLVILPYNPDMPDNAVSELNSFLLFGGKMICFYVMPPALEQVIGIEQGKHMKQVYQGQFASMRKAGKGFTGQADIVKQRSWNIYQARPVTDRSRAVAYWYDEKGTNTGEPAIIVSGNCIQMTHILAKDNPLAKRDLLLAMIGNFIPEIWHGSARKIVMQADRFGPYQDITQACRQILQEAAMKGISERVKPVLDEAGKIALESKNLLTACKWIEAIDAAGRAGGLVERAYCMVQDAQAGEYRAFWCHSPFGVAGMDWDEAVRLLAENGFTAVLPNMAWAGVAYYDSKILPIADEVRKSGDFIEQCLQACRKYGVECHIWKVSWNTGWNAPQEFIRRMKESGRLQVHFDGRVDPGWLCPSHPANQELEISSMVEIARNYAVDGIHFDYIRYPSRDFCFCDGCRERFENVIGARVKKWPADIRNDNKLKEQWLNFRRCNITRVVKAVSDEAREIRPNLKISAAVFSNWQSDRDSIGQDWKLWCDKGYLDFICPMNYTPNNVEFAGMIRQQLEWAGNVPCYPGIGFSVWPDEGKIYRLMEQIKTTRALKSGGFIIFDYNVLTAREIVPLCGAAITCRH